VAESGRMNGEEKALIIAAGKALKLRDVQLHECKFERPSAIESSEDVKARQEHMRGVRFAIGEAEIGDKSQKLLQVLVRLGTRVVSDTDAKDPEIDFVIEAEFLIEYEMTESLEDVTIGAFANHNAVHNVWPFWRQHVYDIVQRARIPHLDIPLYAGIVP
jgi:preprotein translocase subunit SecB